MIVEVATSLGSHVSDSSVIRRKKKTKMEARTPGEVGVLSAVDHQFHLAVDVPKELPLLRQRESFC